MSRSSPSAPSSIKRSCQRQTQVFDLAVRRIIVFVLTPQAAPARFQHARRASAACCGLEPGFEPTSIGGQRRQRANFQRASRRSAWRASIGNPIRDSNIRFDPLVFARAGEDGGRRGPPALQTPLAFRGSPAHSWRLHALNRVITAAHSAAAAFIPSLLGACPAGACWSAGLEPATIRLTGFWPPEADGPHAVRMEASRRPARAETGGLWPCPAGARRAPVGDALATL